MAAINWRTINIDALDPDSASNFDLSTLSPSVAPVSSADVQNTVAQVRQLLRGGDSEGALRGALETVPYGADDRSKVCGCFSSSHGVLSKRSYLSYWTRLHHTVGRVEAKTALLQMSMISGLHYLRCQLLLA